jgi:hypothetical protein
MRGIVVVVVESFVELFLILTYEGAIAQRLLNVAIKPAVDVGIAVGLQGIGDAIATGSLAAT